MAMHAAQSVSALKDVLAYCRLGGYALRSQLSRLQSHLAGNSPLAEVEGTLGPDTFELCSFGSSASISFLEPLCSFMT